MRPKIVWLRAVCAAAGLAVTAAAWLYLAPQQIGGPVSYVITTGSSMEPDMHDGDLILVRSGAEYRVGDAVAYRNPDLSDRVVLHRIVEKNGDRYAFKGDNNDFRDPYRPTEAEFVGKLWWRIPAGGRVLEKLREPGYAALVAGALGLMAAGGADATRRRRNGRVRVAPERVETGSSFRIPDRSRDLLVAAIVATLVFGVLGIVAFGRGSERRVRSTLVYRHSGEFSYSAPAPSGPVYATDVGTGDPIFFRLVDRVRVRFDYEFGAGAEHSVEGSGRLHAVVSNVNGWKRSLPLSEMERFSGDRTTLSGSLDLRKLEGLIDDVERITGVTAQTYSVEFRPEIAVKGSVAHRALRSDFNPGLPFVMDDLQLQPSNSADGAEQPAAAALTPGREGEVAGTRRVPNRIALGPLSIEVDVARAISILGFVLSLAAVAMLRSPLVDALRRDEAARIRARYGPMIVATRSIRSDLEGSVAEVADMAALARVAERYDRPILHEHKDRRHRYYVEGDGLIYVYEAGEEQIA